MTGCPGDSPPRSKSSIGPDGKESVSVWQGKETPSGLNPEGVERPGDGLFSAPSCPGSIVGAGAFHFRVRDGNGWGRAARITRSR